MLAALRRIAWVVYCKRPFSGPAAVLAYLARYTHRVAISNSRLIACDADGVSFHWKDYRDKGRQRSKEMRLSVDEFIRRFLLHVLPDGFHRIRHDGLFGNGVRQANLARARALLAVAGKPMADAPVPDALIAPSRCCPCCRRSHDHHREVRSRMCTAFCGLSPHPDRHLMTTRLPARDLHAADDGCCIRCTGARCFALCGDHDASPSVLLALREDHLPGSRQPSRRAHPHRIRSVMVAHTRCQRHNPHNIRSVSTVFRGFLL